MWPKAHFFKIYLSNFKVKFSFRRHVRQCEGWVLEAWMCFAPHLEILWSWYHLAIKLRDQFILNKMIHLEEIKLFGGRFCCHWKCFSFQMLYLNSNYTWDCICSFHMCMCYFVLVPVANQICEISSLQRNWICNDSYKAECEIEILDYQSSVPLFWGVCCGSQNSCLVKPML